MRMPDGVVVTFEDTKTGKILIGSDRLLVKCKNCIYWTVDKTGEGTPKPWCNLLEEHFGREEFCSKGRME